VDIMQVADAGAAALVTEMIKSSWESFRASVSGVLRRDGEQSAARVLQLVDDAREQLVDSPADQRAPVEDRLCRELTIQLAAFLQRHPDAAAELEELAEQAGERKEGAGPRASVQHNTNSQVVISGGSINASGGFHYRSPEAGR
jgi:hypothetical protein